METQRYEYTKLQRASDGKFDDNKSDCSDPMVTPATASNFEPKKSQSPGSNNNVSAMATAAAANRPTNPRLTEDRLRRLESIGFEWKVKHKMKRYYDKQWDQMFARLLAFKEQTGHCMVPKRYPPDMKL